MVNFWLVIETSIAIMAICSLLGLCAVVFIAVSSVERTKILRKRK